MISDTDSDTDRVKQIRKNLNTFGYVDLADVEFLLKLLVTETSARFSFLMDEPSALKEAKKLWGEE